MLESRLDNVVYRLGIAPTRLAARQMVSHKHILVNDRVVNIASYIVKIGDLVSLSEKAKKSESLLARVNMKSYGKSTWLEWDQDRMLGRVLSLPERNEIPESINERHVVEFYSK
jgi:small subunit ribosomal protein S4